MPGGATVVYRDRSGMRLVRRPGGGRPAAGTCSRPMSPRAQRFSWRIAQLGVDLSSDGRRALVPLAGHTAALIDVATGRSRTLHRLDQPDLSPDGREVVWVRDRGGRCDVAVRSLASGRTRSLRRLPCASEVPWDGPRIALLSWGAPRRSSSSSTRRPALRGAGCHRAACSASTARAHPARCGWWRSATSIATSRPGSCGRTALATRCRSGPTGASTRADQTLPPRSTCRTVRMRSFTSAQSDQPAT